MLNDALVSFVPYTGAGGGLSLVSGAGIAIRSVIIDLLGLGQGVSAAQGGQIIGNPTVFGMDAGIGGRRPELNITIGTALAAAAGTTLKCALQAAIDNGAALPGTWTDIASQDNISLTNGAAGAVIARFPFLPTMPANLRPRFLSLLFSPQLAGLTPGGNFTAGSILSALVTFGRDDQANRYAGANYSVL